MPICINIAQIFQVQNMLTIIRNMQILRGFTRSRKILICLIIFSEF